MDLNIKRLFVGYSESFDEKNWVEFEENILKTEHSIDEKGRTVTLTLYLKQLPTKPQIKRLINFQNNEKISGIIELNLANVAYVKKNITQIFKSIYSLPASSISIESSSSLTITLLNKPQILEYEQHESKFLKIFYSFFPMSKVEKNLPEPQTTSAPVSEEDRPYQTLYLWRKEANTNHKLETKYRFGFTNWSEFYWLTFSKTKQEADKQRELYDFLEPEKWYDCCFTSFSPNSVYSKDVDGILIDAKTPESFIPEKVYELPFYPLSIHTKNSSFDGINTPREIINRAKYLGIKYIGITDVDSVQSLCEMDKLSKEAGISVCYGLEVEVIEEEYPMFLNDLEGWDKQHLCVFDIETTGLYPLFDDLLQISIKKITLDFVVKDTLTFYVKTDREIPAHITELTGITTDIVNREGIDEYSGLQRVLEFIKSSLLVAHNGINFDFPFLNAKLRKNNLPEIDQPILDSMRLSQYLFVDKNFKSHSLKNLSKKAGVEYDETQSHSADYDVVVLTSVLKNYLLPELKEKNLSLLNLHDVSDQLWSPHIYNYVHGKNVLIYIKNQEGVRDLYRLVSLSHTDFFFGSPKLTRSHIEKYRHNFIVVSSQLFSLAIDLILKDDRQELRKELEWYDYISIFPPSLFYHEVERNYISEQNSIEIIKILIDVAEEVNTPYLINYPIRYTIPEEWERYSVLINTEGISGKRHPLYRRDSQNVKFPLFYIRSFKEIQEEFKSIEKPTLITDALANQAAFLVSFDRNIEVIKNHLCPPSIPNCKEMLRELCWKKLLDTYGENPDQYIVDKYNAEVTSICDNNYEVIYWVSHLLVKKSKEDGYLVGSRGSVGSSFVAYLMNISEINPLIPHYKCKPCSYFEKVDDFPDSGFDLPSKPCPCCGNVLETDGQNIPFETFLGFDGNKVPDIDLNFSGEYQLRAHQFLKEYFGEKKVFRAGTISTIAKKTAENIVDKYLEITDQLSISAGKRRWLQMGVTDVKRTSGQHPGGILVVPHDMEIYDFTPYNFPANDKSSSWYTTHFEFEYLHDALLKFDILGHDDPTALAKLKHLTQIDPSTIRYNDPKILELYKSCAPMNINPDDLIRGDGTGALALPEFGTQLTRDIIKKCQPSSFADLIRISGFSHGTGVWRGNIDQLVEDKEKYPLNKVITCRDDIMLYLIRMNLSRSDAFQITEDIRKGKGVSSENESILKKNKIPAWWINSARKISYIFPKAHASAYVLMSWKLAFYKLYHPLAFYSVWFTLNIEGFDYDVLKNNDINMVKSSYKVLNQKLKQPNVSAKMKDKLTLVVYEVAVEFLLRGFTFSSVNINYSYADRFEPLNDSGSLIPPLSVISGLGAFKSQQIVDEREQSGLFESIEDLIARTPLSKISVEKLKDREIFPPDWLY